MGELDAKPRKPSNLRQVLWAVLVIAAGCVANNFVLELIISKKRNPYADPKAGGLMTFLQFVVVAGLSAPQAFAWRGFAIGKRYNPRGGLLASLRGLIPFKLRTLVVPFKHYIGMTALFFTMSYLNNAAFAFHISQPLHMVFRSSSLMMTYAMGRLFFRKQYTGQQLLAVVLLTLGALAATAAEALWGDTASAAAAGKEAVMAAANGTNGIISGAPCAGGMGCGDNGATGARALLDNATGAAATAMASASGDSAEGAAYMFTWFLGILILIGVLVLQTLLGNYQNWTAGTFGRAPQEGMFWSHTLSLPVFLLTAGDMASRGALWAATPPLRQYMAESWNVGGSSSADAGLSDVITQLLLLPFTATPLGSLPTMWALVLLNAVTQWVCVTGVYTLTSVSDPLTVNVTLTVRKSVSLLLSIWAFGNTFTPPHWVGSCLVFGGALLYGLDLKALFGSNSSSSASKGDEGAAKGKASAGASANRRPTTPRLGPTPAPSAAPSSVSRASGGGGPLGWLWPKKTKEKGDDDATQSTYRLNQSGGPRTRSSYYSSRGPASSPLHLTTHSAAPSRVDSEEGDATPVLASMVNGTSAASPTAGGAAAQPSFPITTMANKRGSGHDRRL